MRERSIMGVARRERTIGSAGLRFSRNLRCSSLDSFMYFATSLRRSSTPLRLLPLRRAFSISCACPQRASAAERKSTSVGLRRAERSGRAARREVARVAPLSLRPRPISRTPAARPRALACCLRNSASRFSALLFPKLSKKPARAGAAGRRAKRTRAPHTTREPHSALPLCGAARAAIALGVRAARRDAAETRREGGQARAK